MKRFGSYFHGITLFFIAKCAVLIPVSYKLFASDAPFLWIVHTISPYFSLYNSIKPLAGAFGGLGGALTIAFASLITTLFVKGTAVFSAAILSLHLPGLCASLYWATRHWFVRVAIPFICVALFVVHPVGMGAWAYTLLWFVPMIVWTKRSASLFEHALSSTVIAHSVGSVIWLYTLPSTSSFWISLIPVALTERFFFAVCMVIAYHVYSVAVSVMRQMTKTSMTIVKQSFAA